MGDSQIEISHELFEMSYKINSHRISLIGDIRIVWEILVPCVTTKIAKEFDTTFWIRNIINWLAFILWVRECFFIDMKSISKLLEIWFNPSSSFPGAGRRNFDISKFPNFRISKT